MGTPETSKLTPEQVAAKRDADTQRAYTKGQQEIAALKAQVSELEKLAKPEVIISETDRDRLEDLKTSNPELWRQEMNSLETSAKQTQKELLDQAVLTATKAGAEGQKQQALIQFNTDNNINITNEMLQLDVPARLYAKFEAGEVTYSEYLNSAKEFLTKPKVVGNGQETMDQPNLNNSGGGATPQDSGIQEDIVKDYANINL